MRWYFGLFRLNIKRKLLNRILCLFGHTELHIARNLICVLYLDPLNNTLWLLTWHQCSKVKHPFLNEENVRLHFLHNICAMLLTGKHQLFLKNRIESVSIDARDT